MEKQIRQYAPDSQTTSGRAMNNSGSTGNQRASDTTDGKASELYDEVGHAGDSDEDESGVDRRDKNSGTLTGTDKDETESGENMATES